MIEGGGALRTKADVEFDELAGLVDVGNRERMFMSGTASEAS